MAILNEIYDQNRQVSQAFSAKPSETGEAARIMNKRLADAEYRAACLQKQIYDTVAAGYQERGNVLHFLENGTPAQLRELADRIAMTCGGTAAVYSGDETGWSICLISHTDDLKALGQRLKERFNARGGGKPGTFQGTLQAAKEELEAFFQ